MNYRPIYRSFMFLLKSRQYCTKVPLTPNTTLEKDVYKETVTVNESTIALLERLSLVKFDTKDGVKVLEDSIIFANKILHIDTDGVEPLYTVLEKENLSLREDKVTQGNCQADILKNAMVIEDDYFVAPPGNIPLHEVECEEKQTSIKNECRNQKDSKQMPKVKDALTTVSLEKPSLILLSNIRLQYLQFTYAKTSKNIPIFLRKDDKKVPYGFIEPILIPNKFELKENDNDYNILTPTELKLHLVYPKQDIMQYFIKWQRYRKYWWSSITTTPSLFLINDMKQEDNIINVNITANFPWGQQVVESIKLNTDKSDKSCLVCKLGIEIALLTIMLDAASNGTKEGYVRLHNKLAPYKFSFAFNLQDTQLNQTMIDLAKLINYKLALKKISTWLPEFSVDLQEQIKQNLQLGIPYTILLDDLTLRNGILNLMNSSTMLKEQIHIADLESYAQILCKNFSEAN